MTNSIHRRAWAAGLCAALSVFALGGTAPVQAADTPDYAAIVAAPDRSDADRQTDQRRAPVQMLAFTGARPGMMVLDREAGAGYSSELLARAAKVQDKYKPRYDLTKLAADRRVLARPQGTILTDDFAPVETMRAIAKNNEKWKEQTDAPR